MANSYGYTGTTPSHPQDTFLEIQIITTSPCRLSLSSPRSVRIFSDGPFDVFEWKLSLELYLKTWHGRNQPRTCLFEHRSRRHSAVCLYFDEKVGMERMWDLVSCEKNLRHRKKLTMQESVSSKIRWGRRDDRHTRVTYFPKCDPVWPL